MSQTRVNKYLATNIGLARREADSLVDQGRVTINGQVAILGAHVNDGDHVMLDGKEIPLRTQHTLIAVNKPVGYVCSRKKQGDSPTIYTLLPSKYQTLKLVGRLDRNSSGLILLTSDGDLSHRLTHPSFAKQKIYQVSLDRDLAPLHHQMIVDHGIILDDGVSQFQLQRDHGNNSRDWLVTMHEGRNRQIRRTFSALGYTVVKLHRTNFGNYALGDIKPGEYKSLNIS